MTSNPVSDEVAVTLGTFGSPLSWQICCSRREANNPTGELFLKPFPEYSQRMGLNEFSYPVWATSKHE